jgi:hypothetical protein
MARLADDRAAEHLRQQAKKARDRPALEGERRRQLDEHHGEPVAELARLVEEAAQRARGRDAAARRG